MLARFADYGFNKSHAAAYALVAYQTAYMKANYPVEFLAASMTYAMANTDKLAEFRAEAQRLGIKVEPPSVNRSGADFDVEENTILYALAALKGVGAQAVEAIVEARGEKPFRDITDFASRINPRAINKRVLESLAASGAFDALEGNRARAYAGVDAILAAAQRQPRGGGDRPERHVRRAVDAREDSAARGGAVAAGRTAAARIRRDRLLPLRPSARRLRGGAEALKVQSWTAFANSVKQGATAGRVAGTVVARAERRTKTGNKMGILEFSDPSGHYEAVIFQEGLTQYRDLLEPGTAVLLFLTAEAQGDDVRARIQTVEPLDEAAEKLQKGLRVFLVARIARSRAWPSSSSRRAMPRSSWC